MSHIPVQSHQQMSSWFKWGAVSTGHMHLLGPKQRLVNHLCGQPLFNSPKGTNRWAAAISQSYSSVSCHLGRSGGGEAGRALTRCRYPPRQLHRLFLIAYLSYSLLTKTTWVALSIQRWLLDIVSYMWEMRPSQDEHSQSSWSNDSIHGGRHHSQ